MEDEKHNSLKAIFYAFLANLGIGITKLTAAILTGSGSMLAESIHSFADTSNQILLFIGLKRSNRPPDSRHPLGYGKTIYFWSFLVAILLFSMGGVFSIYEGIHKLDSKEEMKSVWIALMVLGISILLESFSLIGAIREINKIRKNQSFLQWLKESRNAELIVVLGEDVAALFGLVFAFLFVSLAYFFHNPMFDAVGSIVIGGLLIVVSILISIRIQSMLIGESANKRVQNQIETILKQHPGIIRVFNVITIQLGPHIMLSAKIQLKSHFTITEAVNEINQLEKSIKENIKEIKWCFIEPDVAD